jgi:hypothetical protein
MPANVDLLIAEESVSHSILIIVGGRDNYRRDDRGWKS